MTFEKDIAFTNVTHATITTAAKERAFAVKKNSYLRLRTTTAVITYFYNFIQKCNFHILRCLVTKYPYSNLYRHLSNSSQKALYQTQTLCTSGYSWTAFGIA